MHLLDVYDAVKYTIDFHQQDNEGTQTLTCPPWTASLQPVSSLESSKALSILSWRAATCSRASG